MSGAVPCPTHPEITLPRLLACPLCAQAARQVEYARQRQASVRPLRSEPMPAPVERQDGARDAPAINEKELIDYG